MPVFVCLLRGVNVGGHNKVPMAAWRALLEGLGFASVETYIQSGNAVFRARGGAPAAAKKIAAAMQEAFGFAPLTLVLESGALEDVIARCPYRREADADGRRVHVFFLAAAIPPAALAAIEAAPRTSERWALSGNALYLHTPDGFGASKFASVVDRKLSALATARNWATVLALRALAAELGALRSDH